MGDVKVQRTPDGDLEPGVVEGRLRIEIDGVLVVNTEGTFIIGTNGKRAFRSKDGQYDYVEHEDGSARLDRGPIDLEWLYKRDR